MSMNSRWGALSGLVKARAAARSPERAYSSALRTPRLSVRLTVDSNRAFSRSTMNSGLSGWPFSPYSSDSARPGAEMDPQMNATPMGSKGLGGRAFAAYPAQKLCRSPDTVTNPSIRWSRMKS